MWEVVYCHCHTQESPPYPLYASKWGEVETWNNTELRQKC